MTNDNVIPFPSKDDLDDMRDFEDRLAEHDKLVEAVCTMLDVHAQGIVNGSDDVDWNHMMDAMLQLVFVCGIRSGMTEEAIKELLQTDRMIEVEFDE